MELDVESFEREKKWREVRNKYVPLILGWRAAGYSKNEVHDVLHNMLQHGDIKPTEYLLLEYEVNKSLTGNYIP
jgi:hypothetical protein